jgi:M6 family metalloprotease-like protein
MSRTPLLPVVLLVALSASDIAAQDIEMLGRRYGTQPPAGYLEAIERDPQLFRLTRGRAGRGPFNAVPQTSQGDLALGLGPRSGPVLGDIFIPMVLGKFLDSPFALPFDRAEIETAFFGDGPGTVKDFYTEVSGGRVTIIGQVTDWVGSSLSARTVTGGESAIDPSSTQIGQFIHDLLGEQVGIDWGAFDNDGPDGIPNSGDDDGFVDALAVMHPDRGGECGGAGAGDRIWSHKWSLVSAGAGVYTTESRAANGGFIRVDDYFVQGVESCDNLGEMNEIGVFTHEAGHAFGLPDLYDTCSGSVRCPEDGASHAGAGRWELMASGSWGCDGNTPETPCHMGAWSKEMLGWANVISLGPDLDHGTLTLSPVETDGTIYRVDASDGSGEYFLLENRQRLGYDANLFAEGLLIWQIDPDWIASRWPSNLVNANAHMGVWLAQADGSNDLGRSPQKGDSGDPFPGRSQNPAFHAGSSPASESYEGTATGVTIFDIEPSGDDMRFRLVTGFTTVTVQAVGAASPDGIFTVNGQQVDPPATTFVSAPYEEHEVEAIAGEMLGPGERRPFLEWVDDALAPRSRTIVASFVDSTFTARYGGSEFELSTVMTGGVNGIEPGRLVSQPASSDLWFAPGVSGTLEAIPQVGFAFTNWSGDFAGQGNPASFTMTGPLFAGVDFDLIYAVESATVDFPAATTLSVTLEAENGNPPFVWTPVSGVPPEGVQVSARGVVSGAALEMGTFVVTYDVEDALGLQATGTITFESVAPQIPIEQLSSPFLLSGPTLTSAQAQFLDREGNATPPYDIGDFRSWVLAHPELPMSGNFSGVLEPRTVVIPTTVRTPEDGR